MGAFFVWGNPKGLFINQDLIIATVKIVKIVNIVII